MPAESELVNPLCEWFRSEYGRNNLLLIYEEPQGRGGRRPDLLVVVARFDSTSIDDVVMVPAESRIRREGRFTIPETDCGS